MAIGLGTAILGSALVGGAAGIYGANKAASAQEKAAQNALAFQQSVFGQNQANLEPFITAGKGALGKISDLYGLNGNPAFGPEAMQAFRSSPDYDFAFKEGLNALQNSAAARGGLMSGNFMRAAQTFGQGLATQQFGNYFNRLFGVANQGQNAAGALAGVGANQAGQIGNTMMAGGQAQASGIVGGVNALTGSLTSGVNNYALLNALNRSSYGGSGVSPYNYFGYP